jgi:hypothetical protein
VLAELTVFLFLCGAVSPIRAQQNTPPIISPIPAQVTEEDTPLIGIPFTVWDAETPPEQLTFSTMLGLPDGSFSRDRMFVSGSGTNRQLSIYPPPDNSGTAVAFLTVQDSGGLTAAVKFDVLLRPINDAPRLSAIADQVALRGQGIVSVPFTVFDPDSSAAAIRLTAWSSRPSVVSSSDLRFGQAYTNRTLLIPLIGSVGSTAITIQASDTQATNTMCSRRQPLSARHASARVST